MLSPRYESASLQSDFYRDQFRRMLRKLIWTIFFIFLLIGITIYLILFQPTLKYYGNTTDGKILMMPPAQLG